jgi:hypothetical protein
MVGFKNYPGGAKLPHAGKGYDNTYMQMVPLPWYTFATLYLSPVHV